MGLNDSFWDQLAVDSYKRLLKKNADNPLILNNMGLAYLRIGKPRKAAASFRKALRCDKTYLDPHYHLAKALLELGQAKQAKQSYEKYRSLCDACKQDASVVEEHLELLDA